MTTDLSRRMSDINDGLARGAQTGGVRYTIQASKSFSYDGDVLSSLSTDITFSLFADTTDIATLSLPWATGNVPWVSANNFRFVSWNVEPNMGNRLTTFTRWSEVYRKVSGEAATSIPKYFDVTETVHMPVWVVKFWYASNKRLGLGNDEAVTKRLRQVFGLTPVQGEISARTLEPIDLNADPYSFLNKTFGGFDGVIRSATVSEVVENGKTVYNLSLSWSGGKVGAGDLPTYTV
jgi:hypothetical protein